MFNNFESFLNLETEIEVRQSGNSPLQPHLTSPDEETPRVLKEETQPLKNPASMRNHDALEVS